MTEKAAPVEWSPAKRRQKDVDARWTKKHGKSYLGYKLSVSVDRRHKLIRCVRVSDASEADTRHLVDVLDRSNSSRDFWADRGYHDTPREQWLRMIGWQPHIQRKSQAGKPISQRSTEQTHRQPRVRVEHVFVSLAQMGGKMTRRQVSQSALGGEGAAFLQAGLALMHVLEVHFRGDLQRLN